MKRNLLLALLLSSLIFSSLPAQKVSYSYDNAGNRIARTVIQLSTKQSQSQSEIITESFGKHEILIYPNPTLGALAVKILNLETIDQGEVFIVNTSGQIILNQKITSTLMHFDLSNEPSGMYLMRMQLNGELTNWKIIKQ